jgi:hypothetical protein
VFHYRFSPLYPPSQCFMTFEWMTETTEAERSSHNVQTRAVVSTCEPDIAQCKTMV